jgi:hypothetical protein
MKFCASAELWAANEAVPDAEAPAETLGSLPAIADIKVKDANYYRAVAWLRGQGGHRMA